MISGVTNMECEVEKMKKYYDWEKTLSYDADVTMVIGASGVGKTFGRRKQFIREWVKRDGDNGIETIMECEVEK